MKVEFHNTPKLTREYVNNWLIHARKGGKASAGQIAVLEDVVKMLDVAISVLDPVPAAPANPKKKSDGKDIQS